MSSLGRWKPAKQSSNKIMHSYWVGLPVECLETEQRSSLPAKNPCAPLHCTHVPESVLLKCPLAASSRGVGRGISAEQSRSFRYMKANMSDLCQNNRRSVSQTMLTDLEDKIYWEGD